MHKFFNGSQSEILEWQQLFELCERLLQIICVSVSVMQSHDNKTYKSVRHDFIRL